MRYIPFLLVLIVASCSQPEPTKKASYVDLKGYFELEAQRLNKANPAVFKTVAHNDAKEARSVKDIDWETELSLFIGSDLNKPAWRDSYKLINQAGKIVYRASDPDLKTREISILKDSLGKITKVSIVNHTKNLLYSSDEQLLYIPDSLYQISKRQHVAVIGENRYFIKGLFGQ